MQTIEHSGELKVGVPGDYAPLAFRNAAGELQGYDVTWPAISGARWG